MSIALPNGMGAARFAANVVGGKLGYNAYLKYVFPALPAIIASNRHLQEAALAATVLFGAMLGNVVYSKVSGS